VAEQGFDFGTGHADAQMVRKQIVHHRAARPALAVWISLDPDPLNELVRVGSEPAARPSGQRDEDQAEQQNLRGDVCAGEDTDRDDERPQQLHGFASLRHADRTDQPAGPLRCVRGRPSVTGYPLTPKTTAHLRPGQFWSIPMSDGRFGCGQVLRADTGSATGGRTRFIGAILDGVGDAPPDAEAIAGSAVLAVGNAHVRLISFGGGAILGATAPRLQAVTPGLGSRRRNDAAAALLGLPPVREPDDWAVDRA